jgi:hypothetical protein
MRNPFDVAIVLIVVGIVGIISCWECCRWTADHDVATSEAEKFSENISGVTKIECVARDTDGDGYVSCTLFRGNKDPLFIECAGSFTTNTGCRAPKSHAWYE